MRKKLLNLCLMAIMMVFSMSAYALSQKDGVYQIGTAQDFRDFAALVNGSEPYACAELTADIDLGLIDLGSEGTDGTMIGKDGQDFQGTFDGKGHSITINYFSGSDNGTALFRNVGIKALIQNLKVQGTITSSTKYAAGIAAWNAGNIRNCYVDVSVKSSMAGDATDGGICGVAYRGTVIQNCLAKFIIDGSTTQNCGGVAGWCDARINITNCLVVSDGSNFDLSNGGSANIARNTGNINAVNLESYNADPYANRPSGACSNNYVTNQWGDNNATTVVSYADLADGKICYQLNTDQSKINWVQRIGTDPFPVPAPFGTGQVYASGATGCNGQAEGDLTYSNTGTAQATAHTFDKYGVCTACGCFNFDYEFDHKDRAIILKTADDIFRAEGWNRIADGFKLNMKMANDIEIISEPGQNIFNTSNWVDGNFDGDGHTLTIEMTNIEGNNASFIPEFSGTFKNVIMHGTISTNGQYAGSVTSHTRNSSSIIKNVYSDINIYTTHTGDNTTGGFVGVGETDYRIENCIYAGTIEGIEGTECLAGISGWSSGNCTMVNVAFLGDLINAGGDSKLMSRNPSKVIPTNGYFLNDCGVEEDARFTQIEEGDIASGKLAFLLNANVQGADNFYQVIGTDPTPMPIAKAGGKVYAAAPSYRCDGTPEGDVQYSNTETSINIPPHNYVGGFCTVCDHIDENYIKPSEDGWFEIGTADELIWWSHYAAEVNLGVSGRLTADIDMSEATTDKPYAIVGNEQTPFYGNFDGQFHTISNFRISYPGQRGVGLIGVMNSRGTTGDGMSDADARSAEGVFIKDVVLDETCEIEGLGYCGIVGMTASWAGHVTFLNVGMDGHVVCTEGANAGGVLGCVMGSTCHITIDNCYMTGNCDGPLENGSFSGWLGSYCEIKNCYAIGVVTGAEAEDTHKYFARYGSATITNCYTLYGGTVDEDGHQVYRINEEDIANGKFTYLLNGKQFRTSLFYQDLEVDAHPVANPAHGTIVYAAGEYMTANAETLPDVVNKISEFYTVKAEEAIAYTGAIEDLQEKIGALNDVTDLNSLADALDEIYVSEAVVDASVKVYKKYADKVEETKIYLAENDTFEGEDRDELLAYLEGEAEEILDAHELPDSQIEKEITRIDEWLARAIYKGYIPGTDITKMLVNPDFSDGKDKGWDGETKATGHAAYTREDGTKVYGIESWSANPFAMTQTVKGMKPGYYLVGVNASYRPQNNRYSYNYAAQVSANGNVNFLQTVIEDYMPVADAIDGVNCNINIASAYDLPIYDDFVSTGDESGAELIGYAVHGITGIAIAGGAGRYQNYIACEVGADSVLTIGIANPHSKVGTNEWTGAANVRLTFLGDNEDAAAKEGLGTALESQLARAYTILDPEKYGIEIADETEAVKAPNFPAELKIALEAAIAEAEAAETPEQKYASIKKLSQLFQDIYAGKQAYKNMAEAAQAADNAIMLLTDIISEADYDAILAGIEEINIGYAEGSVSLQDAQNFDITKQIPTLAKIVAPQDENGTYQIGTPLQLVYFSATVSSGGQASNAVLTSDINMAGIPFTPIAHGTRYNGVFDGQGYAITNLTIGSPDEYCDYQNTGLFSDIENGTVKNLKVQSTIYTYAKFAGGVSGYTRNAKIQDCDVDVTVHSLVDGDGTHGGIAGVNEVAGTVVENCKVHFVLDGETTTCWGGIFGWSTNTDDVKNCIIVAEIVAANMDGSNSVSRNSGNCTCSNVYFTTKLNETNIGTYIEATDPRFQSGELTWTLNGSSGDNPHWFQTLGKDDMPHLFGGSIVWKNGTEYQNIRPNIQLNSFASNLSTATNANQVVVAYTLNAEAKSAAINFYAGGELKYSHVLKGSDLMAGGHEIAIDNSLLGVAAGTEMTYELDVTAMGVTTPTKVGESYKVWGPYGMAINNNPASKGFGQILLAESYAEPLTNNIYISYDKPGALFAFDANFQPINSADGTPGFYGGLPIKDETPLVIGGTYNFDLKDIRFTEDGRLFIARAAGLTNSSVYEINPEDLDEPWKPVFTGGTLDAATGITYVGEQEQCRMAVSLAFEGKGADLKMYVLGGQRSNGEYNTSDYKCSIYNLGTAAEWTTAPSANFEPLDGVYTIAPSYVGIQSDGRGGLWYIQHRSSPTEEQPSLKHFDATGKEDYNSLVSTNGARIAVTTDGQYLAIPQGSGKIVLYETNYVPMANGRIFLNPVRTINVSESSITSLAFDYANNLYVASGGTETFSRYSIPSWTDNKCVTPAREGFTVGSESGDPDAIKSLNGNTTNGAIYNIAGQRVSKAQKGIFIQDGKKVANK